MLPTVIVHNQRDDSCEKECGHRSKEEHEDAMVVKTDAVIDPWAMVIESFNTPVADAAVAGAIGTHNLAVGAEKDRVEDLHHIEERDAFRTLEVARVFEHSKNVEEHGEQKQSDLQVDQRLSFIVHYIEAKLEIES